MPSAPNHSAPRTSFGQARETVAADIGGRLADDDVVASAVEGHEDDIPAQTAELSGWCCAADVRETARPPTPSSRAHRPTAGTDRRTRRLAFALPTLDRFSRPHGRYCYSACICHLDSHARY
jgi:hypothetical protein